MYKGDGWPRFCILRQMDSLRERRRSMTHIELKPEETGMLREVLESYLSDLRLEVGDTKKASFREELKRKEVFLKDVLKRLE
jgi:hypothetical protein